MSRQVPQKDAAELMPEHQKIMPYPLYQTGQKFRSHLFCRTINNLSLRLTQNVMTDRGHNSGMCMSGEK